MAFSVKTLGFKEQYQIELRDHYFVMYCKSILILKDIDFRQYVINNDFEGS